MSKLKAKVQTWTNGSLSSSRSGKNIVLVFMIVCHHVSASEAVLVGPDSGQTGVKATRMGPGLDLDGFHR